MIYCILLNLVIGGIMLKLTKNLLLVFLTSIIFSIGVT